MGDLTAVLLAVVLLGLNAFFLGAEFALISARRSQIEPLADAGSAMARSTLRAMERVSVVMAGAQFLGFTEKPVSTVLMATESLATVRRGASGAEVEDVCAATGFSRFPVENDAGDLVGYLHV